MHNCVLHIGTGKTGTTSIQNVLSRRRKLLREAGVLYPQCLGRANHEAAAVFASDFHPGFTKRKAPGVDTPEDLAAYRIRLKSELEQEMRDSGCDKLVISNEHLFEKVRKPEHASRVCDLVGLPLDAIQVVVYLRPQPDMAAAVYAELLRMGAAPKYESFLQQQRTRDLINYEEGLNAWAAVLGDDAIKLRVFDRARLVDGDVLSDFASVAGIDGSLIAPGPDIDGVAESRRSFDAPTVAFLNRFNAEVTNILKETGDTAGLELFKTVPHRRMIVRSIDQMQRKGQAFAFDGDTAESIRKQFEDSNERLFARFGVEPFSERELSTDAGSPEDALDVDHAFELMARLWIQVLRETKADEEAKGNERPAY